MTLKPRLDGIGWVLFIVGLFFAFIAIAYPLFRLPNYQANFNLFMPIAFVIAFAFVFYQYYRQSHIKKQNSQLNSKAQ